MLKIKSKAILAFTGLMVAAFVLLGAYSASADLVTLPASGVSKASSMENVKNLQTFLNWNLGSAITPLVVDGLYGAKTTAAIRMFQTNNGLVADGVFGKLSTAKAMALQANMSGGTYPAGCASATGFSSTTGMPCAGGSFPAGCTSAMGFSSTTGAPCNGPVGTLPAGCTSASGFSVTTGQACTATTVNQGTNGYLADFASDSTNRVSTVYESEMDKVVAGVRGTARLASQSVTRVRVTFVNTNSANSSANLAKYISSASLWYGSTKLATMAVTDADRATATDTYTFNFSGMNANIAKDQIGRFYVSVTANGSIDSNDTDATWTVSFPIGGIQAVSPDGSVDTYDSAAYTVTNLGFNKFSSNGVKATVALSSSNPAANTVAVSSTANTNDVTVLKFTIKATNSDLTLRKVPVQILSTGANVSSIINTIKLYNGATLVDSLDGGTVCDLLTGAIDIDDCSSIGLATNIGYLFSNLGDYKVTAGTTAEFSVVVDLKKADGVNYSAGATLTASLANLDVVSTTDLAFSVNDVNGDQLTRTSTYRVGSAIGEIQTLRVNGVNTVVGSSSVSTTTDQNGNITSVTYTIPVSVTAFGDTLYMGQTGQLASTATASNAFALVFENSSAPTVAVTSSMTNSITLSSSNASIESNGFRLDSGSTKNFTITVNLTDPAVYSSSYRVRLDEIRTFTEAGLVTGTNNDLLPQANFRTGFQLINS